MNFIEKFDDLQVPEENIPELLEMANKNPELLTKSIQAAGNQVRYSVAETQRQASDLVNKQIAFLGSSVTYGAASFGESFVDYLVKKDGIFAFKEAVSGTTLAEIDDGSYVTRLEKLPVLEKISAFVLQLSTNDARNDQISIGKISENDKYDITTVTGAIEYILDYVKKTWNCPVIVFSNPKFKSDRYQEMVEMTKNLEKKWNFTFLNLWEDPAFDYSDKERELYMFDSIHPTRAGYQLSWTPVFERALNKIIESN
ncbi:SGNH/GDSL hydrolase family protein [uncultured Lactobacillus sp.]|uniref:SGNH/GDSL hydrolase family protein n=1 Tax=uncultured Lactobacillus sp. TaxID=153152 RepID=UPI002604B4B4|nr:SGNH/GDSL hydrolase family protein [uncultured Lactobacillus sp.]